MLIKLVALSAALLTSTGFVPQIIKGLQTKHLKDVSMVTLTFSASGTLLWAIYGIYLNDAIIIGANFFTCATVVTLIAMKLVYGRRG